METKNILNWFNGKKTTIAAALFTVSFFAVQFKTEVLVKIWGVNVPIAFDNSIQTVEWIAGILGGVGLIHKGVKGKK